MWAGWINLSCTYCIVTKIKDNDVFKNMKQIMVEAKLEVWVMMIIRVADTRRLEHITVLCMWKKWRVGKPLKHKTGKNLKHKRYQRCRITGDMFLIGVCSSLRITLLIRSYLLVIGFAEFYKKPLTKFWMFHQYE